MADEGVVGEGMGCVIYIYMCTHTRIRTPTLSHFILGDGVHNLT